MRIASVDLKVVREAFFEISFSNFLFTFDLAQLLAVGESLLCDYSMVVDTGNILEINLTKRKQI